MFLLIGVLGIGLRVVERVVGGLVGEVFVAGVKFVPSHMPLLAVGIASFAVGTAILWVWPRRRR
jgi:hypothetical protein